MTDKTDVTATRKSEATAAEASNLRRATLTDEAARAGKPQPPRDPSIPRFVERTPRDVAINKAKQGEDTGLESSRPDKTERFRVPGRFIAAGYFEDFDGRRWTMTPAAEGKGTLIDPEAVRKDGGDPHLLGVASAPPVVVERGEVPEKALASTSTGNAQPSEDPVQAPIDRARIQSEDHPSTRPGSTVAKAAQAEADAVEGKGESAEEGKATPKPARKLKPKTRKPSK